MRQRAPRRAKFIAVAIVSILFLVTLLFFFLAAFHHAETSDVQPAQAEVEGGAGKRLLKFGKIPNVSPRKAYRLYSVFLDLVGENLACCELELVLAKDYGSCVRMLANGEVDLAWLGTGAYVKNRAQVPMTPFVRPIWEGRSSYRGIIFTVDDAGISSLADLRGKKLAFVDQESASGYYYPALLLGREGFDLDKDFAAVDFLGSHDAVLMGVLLGEYDAGAVFERAYATLADRSRRVRPRILAQTEPIPGEPIVAGPNISPALLGELQRAFLSIPPEKLDQVQLMDFFAFEPAVDADYNGVSILPAR